tara:strand:+ start:9189 stop:9854 length:666 start_codon:yes stop_codon:yes gene_type:complete
MASETYNYSGLGMAMFSIITIFFYIIKYFAKANWVDWGYYLMLALSQMLINYNIHSKMCHESNPDRASHKKWQTTMTNTLIPWILIFILLKLMLIIFPGWLSPFSNTFGYLVTTMFGVKDVLKNIFKQPGTESVDEFKATINYIYSNPTLLINEITTDNFDDFIETMNRGGLLEKGSNNNQEYLKKLVGLKEIVAELIWTLLTGILTINIATNQIINASCQ